MTLTNGGMLKVVIRSTNKKWVLEEKHQFFRHKNRVHFETTALKKVSVLGAKTLKKKLGLNFKFSHFIDFLSITLKCFFKASFFPQALFCQTSLAILKIRFVH